MLAIHPENAEQMTTTLTTLLARRLDNPDACKTTPQPLARMIPVQDVLASAILEKGMQNRTVPMQMAHNPRKAVEGLANSFAETTTTKASVPEAPAASLNTRQMQIHAAIHRSLPSRWDKVP